MPEEISIPRTETLQKPLQLLWPLLRPYKATLAGGILAMAISSAMMLAIGWGLKNIIDHGLNAGSDSVLNRALFGLLGAVLLMAGASYARLKLVLRVAERVITDLRQKVYRHLLTLDPAFFETHKTGDQISRINADTTVLQLVITNNLPTAFRQSLTMIGGLVLLCCVSPAMTGIVMISVPLVIGPMIFFGRRSRARSRDTQTRVGDVSAYSLETLQGIQTIQSFGYEDEAARQFDRLAEETYNTALKYISARAFVVAIVIAMIFGAIGLVFWVGGHEVVAGRMTGGDLSAFIFYAATVAGSVMAMSEAMTEFSRASGASDRIAQLLAIHTSLKMPKGDGMSIDRLAGNIRFDNVAFHYPTRTEHQALDNVSFDIAAGKVSAMVGPSGAGKSTIFQLLQRFYDPQAGIISIDGVDISDLDPRKLRQYFGVVPQDPAIFSMSIVDNIRVAKPDASPEEVRNAAELAQAHEFINALPQKYDTLVGERGSRLSGGQRQRIAIARAILKNPKVLLLDEATSALDSSNEQAVHLALKNLMTGRTTIVIAHRLSTVQNADRIFVMDKGRIVAEGSHAELYGSDALYTHLAGLQLDLKAG